MSVIRILCFGDLVGSVGCALFQKYAQKLKRQYGASVVIVNGENTAVNGRGVTPKTVEALRHAGADMITGGNHSFQQRESLSLYREGIPYLLRPANFPSGCPGKGTGFIECEDGTKIGVINVQGRVFMHQNLDCPFKTVESALIYLNSYTPIVIVDFHAEASAEKIGLGIYFDGKVSAVVGTHTHIQTADERILPNKTAYISDLGMSGSLNSMLGMKPDSVLPNLLTQMPSKFEVDTASPFVVSGVCIEIDATNGDALAIERFFIVDTEFSFGVRE